MDINIFFARFRAALATVERAGRAFAPTDLLTSLREEIYLFTIPQLDIVHSFDNRTISISEFSSCVTPGGRLCQTCSVLQNDSSCDFQHSKQCKYKEKYLSKFSNSHKRKQTSLLAKVNSRCFFSYFPPPCWCPSEGHQHGVHNSRTDNSFDSATWSINSTL